jgi:hypothetical protein
VQVVLALEGGYMGPGVGASVVECVRSLLGETCGQVSTTTYCTCINVLVRRDALKL